MNRSSLRAVGIAFWLFAVIAVAAATQRQPDPSRSSQASALDYLVHRAERIEVVDASGQVRLNDPVFFESANGSWSQVGHIDAAFAADPNRFVLSWYGTEIVGSRFQLTAYRNSGKLDDVIATMFPAEKRQQIQLRLAEVLEVHGEELMTSLLPLAQQALQESLPVIEAEFRASTQRHQAEIDLLIERWNDDLVKERLIPLARREVMPIVRTHGQPIAETIGRELWDRASIWSFGWRAAYDKSPLPRRDLVQQEWDRFVEQDAIPVFDQHMDEIANAVQKMIAEIAAEKGVTDELAAVAISIASDPEAIRLFRDILRESIVDNPQLRQVWRQVWESDQAQSALDLAGQRLEPVVRQIGDDLFGTREEGINPDFARVLRNQILGKDRRWIVATQLDHSDPTAKLVIQPSDRTMTYPMIYLADRGDTREGSQ